MSCVFQNIDPSPPSPPGDVYPPPLLRGEDTLAGWLGGWGVNILEDARHSGNKCSFIYLFIYLFTPPISNPLCTAPNILFAANMGRNNYLPPPHPL
jgi:hypothetical protein